MNKVYFKYLLHTNRNIIAVLFMTCFLIYPFMIFFVDRQMFYSQALDACIWYSFILMILTFCIPIYMQNKRLKKKSVDTFYSLPIKKEKMYHTEMIFGLFLVFVPWVFNYLLGISQYWIKEGSLASGKEVLILIACLIYGFIQYSMNYFLVGKCNNVLDGVITLFAYDFLPVVIFVVAGSFIDMNTVGINAYDVVNFANMSVHGAMYSLVYYFIYRLHYSTLFLNFPIGFLFLLLHCILGILAYREAWRDYVCKPLEEAEQKTTSAWSYRFLIPIYCMLYLSLATYNNGIEIMTITGVLVFLGYLAATFVSNRAIKISARSLVFFASVLLVMNIFTYVFRENKAFGLNEMFPTDYAYVDLDLYINLYDEQKNIQADVSLSDEEIITSLQDLQRVCIDRFYEGQGETIGSLLISYKDSHGKKICNYNYSITKGDEEELLELLKKSGYEIEITDWDIKVE